MGWKNYYHRASKASLKSKGGGKNKGYESREPESDRK
jgi:hypothetical protein